MSAQPDPDSAILIDSGSFWTSPFRMTLRECNLHVFIAGNEDEAVGYARNTIARLLLVLYQSSANHGALYACAQIRNLPNYEPVPIVLVGPPRLDPAARNFADEIGINLLLAMPISTLALKQAILPLLGVTPPGPAMAVEWRRKAEPPPAFDEVKEYSEGRRFIDLCRNSSTLAIQRRTNWADRRRLT